MARRTVLATEEGLAELLRAAGYAPTFVSGPAAAQLDGADLVASGPDWRRLRAWRLAGHRVPLLVLLGDHAPPEQRAVLEPLILLRDADAASVREAVETQWLQGLPTDLHLDKGRVDLVRRELVGPGGTARLTQREADLLAFLAARPSRDVGREELQVQVWGHARPSDNTRAVDMAIARLRKKIEVEPTAPRHLLTSRGGGYRLVACAEPQLQPHELPSVSTSFFGRETLATELRSRLRSGDRLFSLIGAPGTGKTRLALEVARGEVGGPWPGGVWWCDLVPAREEHGVCAAVSGALGLTMIDAPDAVDRIRRVLAGKGPMLIVLDNAEHVVGSVADVLRAWLPGCPDARFVVTSRIRLDIDGEHRLEVPALDSEAARALFIDRALTLGVVVEDGPDLLRLVERLDHLPLAVELAAARVRTLPVPELLVHLDERFRLLVRSPLDPDPRHATLRAALAWSWDLLTPSERASLGALAVFRGGFDLGGVVRVLGCDRLDAADAVDDLLDRSLVRREGERFVMLESVREFALEREQPENVVAVHDAHAAWCLELARRWRPQLQLAAAREAYARLSIEAGNLEAAWVHLGGRDPVGRAELALALAGVWTVRGTPGQRIDLLDETLASHPDQDVWRGLVLKARARAHQHLRAHALVDADSVASAAIFEAVGELDLAARAWVDASHTAVRRAEMDKAREASVRAATLAVGPTAHLVTLHVAHVESLLDKDTERVRARLGGMDEALDALFAGDDLEQAFTGGLLANTVFENAAMLDRAKLVRRRLEAVARELPGRHREGLVRMLGGRSAMDDGRYDEGVERLMDALVVLEQHGRTDALDLTTHLLAVCATHAQQHAIAQQAIDQVVAWKRGAGDGRGVAYAAVVSAVLAMDQGDLDGAELARREGWDAVQGLEVGALEDGLRLLDAFVALVHDRDDDALEAIEVFLERPATGSNQMQSLVLRTVVAQRQGRGEEAGAHLAALEPWVQGAGLSNAEDWRCLVSALERADDEALSALADGRRAAHALVRLLARAAPRAASHAA